MDPETIRNSLKDVFGPFDEFCQQISNTGGTLSARHGVVAPATPIIARSNPFAPTTSHSSSASQSARLCLQKMTELVEPTPLQPPLPSFNRFQELYNDPSSSTRSAPDESEVKRKKRKPKNPDSDSEFERDNRKRHTDHVSKPGTSKTVHEDDAMKELFGDDTAKPSGSEKAVSPDSGVHSNEGLDDTDISSVINLMSNVLPMLSPVTERPQDRERARREKAEKRAQRELERKRKEEEKEQRKRDNRRREEQREVERKAAEEKEKKDAEERIRKDAEERLRKDAEERIRKDAEERIRKDAEEKLRKDTEERLKKEAEEKTRREEEKLRREAEEKQRREEKRREEDRKRKDDERRKKLEERHRKEEEKQRKEEEKHRREEEEERHRKENEIAETLDLGRIEHGSEYQRDDFKIAASVIAQSQEAPSRLTGTLSLQNLSNDKMAQLLDMSRRTNKTDSKGSRPSSPFIKDSEKTKFDRDVKYDIGGVSIKKFENKLDIKSEIKNVPSPLSSIPRRDFHCASKECFPSKPILPTRTRDSDVNQGDTYQELAKTKKRQADALDDYVKRLLLYLECMVYFTLSGQYYALHERSNSRQLSIMRDTCKLIESVTNRFLHQDRLTSLGLHFSGRIRTLSIRAQSILTYHVFHCKMATALKTYKTIEASDDQCSYHNGDEILPAPSPGENLSSETNPDATVTMPLEVFNCYKTQLRQLHGLMNAHKLWADSMSYISKSPTDTLFVNSLESLCGALTIISPVDKMAIFVLTGVAWLREEYELELKRPHPSSKTSLKVQ